MMFSTTTITSKATALLLLLLALAGVAHAASKGAVRGKHSAAAARGLQEPGISVSLVNATASAEKLLQFTGGTVLDLGTLPPTLTIEADPSSFGKPIATVDFIVKSGDTTLFTHTEQAAPFYLAGDKKGILKPFDFVPGNYTLTISVTFSDGSPSQGTSKDFEVQQSPPTVPADLELLLLDASSNGDLGTLRRMSNNATDFEETATGAVILELDELPNKLSAQLDLKGSTHGVVVHFFFDSVLVASEKFPPFTLTSVKKDGSLFKFDGLKVPGIHTLGVVVAEARSGEPLVEFSVDLLVALSAPTVSPVSAPTVSPIEIPTGAPSPWPSAAPSSVPNKAPVSPPVGVYWIDAGSREEDSSLFVANRNKTYSTSTPIDMSAVPGSYSSTTFQTHRYAARITYQLEGLTPFSNYTVVLGFAETYEKNCKKEAGARVFSVTVNGQPFLTDYDVLTKTGCNTAWLETGEFAADLNGTIKIKFRKGAADRPFVSLIQIL